MFTPGILTFNIGDARQCHDVGIVDDVIYETEVEQFIPYLALVSGAPVTVDPSSARVIIFDDTDDCKCPRVVDLYVFYTNKQVS